jgi:hypothetical protein
MLERVIQPIKHDSTEPTQAHTVAVIKRDGAGRVGLLLECFRPRCGCSRFILLEELIEIMEGLEGKENGESSENRAA